MTDPAPSPLAQDVVTAVQRMQLRADRMRRILAVISSAAAGLDPNDNSRNVQITIPRSLLDEIDLLAH